MKRLFILFTIILLTFSTLVIADDDPLRERVKDRIQDTSERIKDGAESANNLVKDGEVVARKVTAQVREAKQKVIAARERYATSKQNYIDKKQELLNLKERYRECLNSDTEDCKLTVKQTKTKSKEHLQNSADLVLKNLEELKERTKASEDLTEEEVNEAIEIIDERITEVEEAKSTLENINEETSSEEIKENANTIRKSWEKVKLHKHRIELRNMGARFRNLIINAEIFGERAEEKASDIGSEELDSLIENYNSEVEKATEQYILAKEKWEETSTPGEIDELVKKTQEHFRATNNYLKEARLKLREIMSELNKNNKEISLEIDEVEE